MSKYILLWLPTLLWALIIFSFSARPTAVVSEINWQDFIFKKTIHVVEYGIFALLLYRSFKGSGVHKVKAVYYSFIIAVLYGISDEFHQSFTPGRTPKLRDVFFDGTGAFIAMAFITKYLPNGPVKLKKLQKLIGVEY